MRSVVVYRVLEKYVVPIGHDFQLFGHGKVMKKLFEKEWSP